MKKRIIVLSAFVIISLLIISVVALNENNNKVNSIKVLSQCYTTLQPSTIFSSSYASPITENHQNNYITININREYYTTQLRDTGSMRPALSDFSDVIYIKPIKNELHVGDVIDFECVGQNITHRIISIKDNIYITKGDNNNIDDAQGFGCNTTFRDIKGKLIGVIY